MLVGENSPNCLVNLSDSWPPNLSVSMSFHPATKAQFLCHVEFREGPVEPFELWKNVGKNPQNMGFSTKIGKTGFWKIDGSFRQRWRSKRCGDLPIALEFGEVNGHGWVGSPTKSGNTRHKVDIGSTLHFQVLLRPLLFGLGWRFGYSDILGKATHVLMLLGIVGLKGCYPQMAFCLKIWPHSNQSKPQRGQEHFEHEVHEADGFSVAGHAQRDPKSQKFLI